MGRLRAELLRFSREDGSLDLLDLLFERTLSLTPDEASALAAEDPALMARLDSQHWCESTVVEQMRASAWAARARNRPAPAPAPTLDNANWSDAQSLPDCVSAEWREAERWRRLAEERAAGRRYLFLPGFLSAGSTAELSRAASQLPFARLDTELVHAQRRLLDENDLPEWRALMASPIARRLFGAVLGVHLPERLFINAWRLERGDSMGVHPDGRLYRGTLSLGLSHGWSAADGGAIAFGDPTAAGFVTRERWLPHAGDALLFAPARDSWHAVEPVLSEKTRYSLTGWWTDS